MLHRTTHAHTGRHRQEVRRTLADTPLKRAVEYYVTNRNCAPVSKRCLVSTLSANVPDWMDDPILEIDTIRLQERYRAVITRVKAQADVLDARYAGLPPEERLLRAPRGYYNGIKAANDTVKGFGRVYRYWVAKALRAAASSRHPCTAVPDARANG